MKTILIKITLVLFPAILFAQNEKYYILNDYDIRRMAIVMNTDTMRSGLKCDSLMKTFNLRRDKAQTDRGIVTTYDLFDKTKTPVIYFMPQNDIDPKENKYDYFMGFTIVSPKLYTVKNIHIGSNFKDLETNYTIIEIVPQVASATKCVGFIIRTKQSALVFYLEGCEKFDINNPMSAANKKLLATKKVISISTE